MVAKTNYLEILNSLMFMVNWNDTIILTLFNNNRKKQIICLKLTFFIHLLNIILIFMDYNAMYEAKIALYVISINFHLQLKKMVWALPE